MIEEFAEELVYKLTHPTKVANGDIYGWRWIDNELRQYVQYAKPKPAYKFN